ncbi:hypothetical protein ABT173_24170, partial [Streptomyces sp. NPDC001795]|uniref:hypothetical protein n=1 Tax=Streptomyces sp. NPDC001795 TaxID=3154525 RepID=UPI003319870E
PDPGPGARRFSVFGTPTADRVIGFSIVGIGDITGEPPGQLLAKASMVWRMSRPRRGNRWGHDT